MALEAAESDMLANNMSATPSRNRFRSLSSGPSAQSGPNLCKLTSDIVRNLKNPTIRNSRACASDECGLTESVSHRSERFCTAHRKSYVRGSKRNVPVEIFGGI